MTHRPVALKGQLNKLWEDVEALQNGGGGGGVAGVTSFNTRTGAVELGSGDVTGVLGFTPQEEGSYALTAHNHEGVYALASHNHVIADVSGLQTALNGKQASGDYALASHDHNGIYQPAGSYAAASHSHVIADVTGLQTALDGKQAAGSYSLASHNHSGVYAPASHSHEIADVTGLQTALDGKQASGSYSLTSHNHSGVYQPAGSYAAASHTHVIADVTGLQAALDGKQASGSYSLTSHNHSGVYEPVISAGNTGQYWRGDKTWQTLPGGADPWAYIKLANDFTTSSATAVDITGLAFTPVANTSYEFEAHLMTRTATATVGPRPGVAWPTGGTDGVASVYTPSSAVAEVMAHGNINAAVLGPVGGLPNTTQSYGAKVVGLFVAGASPSGTVKLQLASETAGTNVIIKAGSFLKYRTI